MKTPLSTHELFKVHDYYPAGLHVCNSKSCPTVP